LFPGLSIGSEGNFDTVIETGGETMSSTSAVPNATAIAGWLRLGAAARKSLLRINSSLYVERRNKTETELAVAIFNEMAVDRFSRVRNRISAALGGDD
jgi:hypothetical protein